MATDVVYKYLKDQNRPFSVNDIVRNLEKEHGKTAVQKALDQLTQSGKIIEKVYGKQKVYCIMQEDENTDPNKMQEELARMDQTITELSDQISVIEEKIKTSETQLKSLQSSLTTDQAKLEKEKLAAEEIRLRSKYDDLSQNTEPISNEVKKKVIGENEKILKEYRRRKRICTEIIESVLEGYPKSKKILLEEVGIETDEEVGFILTN